MSGSASASNAWTKLCLNSSSLLSHRFGLPLAILFKCMEGDLGEHGTDSVPANFKASKLQEFSSDPQWTPMNNFTYFQELMMAETLGDVLDRYIELTPKLATRYRGWLNSPRSLETALTKMTYDILQEHLNPASQAAKAAGQPFIDCGKEKAPLDDGFHGTAYYDLVIQKTGADDKIHPLALFELGQSKQEKSGNLMTKQDQGMKYLSLMAANKDDAKISFGAEPMLMCTIFVDREKRQKWKCSITVFLCWKRPSGRIPRSLLWRKEVSSAVEMAKAVALISAMALSLDKWVSDANLTSSSKHVTLGPNCCKVEVSDGMNSVLRCYDTRLRDTDRKPDIYLSWSRSNDDTLIGETVFSFPDCDEDNLLKFGAVMPVENSKGDSMRDRDWTWEMRGSLLILQTDYVEGSHVASTPADFLPIIQDLVKLHAAGFVHADIRCFNIVFCGPNGTIIDFDMGGKISDNVKYPRGYVRDLGDGLRRGKQGGSVEKWHDWHALLSCIFHCHVFDEPTGVTVGKRKRSEAEQNLLEEKFYFVDLRISSDIEIEELVPRLKQFLVDITAANWTCLPEERFADAIKECETGEEEFATGSIRRQPVS